MKLTGISLNIEHKCSNISDSSENEGASLDFIFKDDGTLELEGTECHYCGAPLQPEEVINNLRVSLGAIIKYAGAAGLPLLTCASSNDEEEFIVEPAAVRDLLDMLNGVSTEKVKPIRLLDDE